MPITSGFDQYLCPGCEEEQFLGKNDSTKKGKWQQRNRVNADKVPVDYSFCENCAPFYDELIKKHDQEVADLLAQLKQRKMEE